MDLLLSSDQGFHTVPSEAPSLASLLERGIECTRQGYYAEGVTLFGLARNLLAPDQEQMASVLDALIHSSSSYLQAQHALLLASKHLLEVDAEQRSQLANLEKQLPVLNQTMRTDSALEASPLLSEAPSIDGNALPALDFTCFGCFGVRRLGQPVALCSNRNGQAILRYLVAKSGHSETIDTLLALLWPEDEQEVAQPKLHIAISALRRSLNEGYTCMLGCGYILCKSRIYHLNPAIAIRTDVDEFLQCYQKGRYANEEQIRLYEHACQLYRGPFLLEDRYADWSFLQREQLNQIYLTMCKALADHYFHLMRYEEAIQWATTVLKENRCDEAAHQQLMHIYVAQGRRSEALLQYQRCERTLREELGVQPLPETTLLFQKLFANEPLPSQESSHLAQNIVKT